MRDRIHKTTHLLERMLGVLIINKLITSITLIIHVTFLAIFFLPVSSARAFAQCAAGASLKSSCAILQSDHQLISESYHRLGKTCDMRI